MAHIITLRTGSAAKHEFLKKKAHDCGKSLNQYLNDAVDCFCLIDDMRQEEGAVIELICDNPDCFGAGPDSIISITDTWTAFEREQFYGPNLLAALKVAYAERTIRNEMLTKCGRPLGESLEAMRVIIEERNRDARAGNSSPGVEGVPGAGGQDGPEDGASTEKEEA